MSICRHCGMGEDEHHAFEAREQPAGCVCDPATWHSRGFRLPPACAEHQGDPEQNCTRCEHDRECHGKGE